ncbi:MAG: sigma-70 family RNA polymerase sigma factor [Candidatus Sulfotelmatobacter sp.]
MQEAQACIGSEPQLNVCDRHSLDEEINNTLSRCRASFFRSAYRFLQNAGDAEDAVQDALLSAYKHIEQFRGEAQMSTWLTAIVANSARMQLRRRPRQIHVSLDEAVGDEQEYTLSDRLADRRPSPEDECRNFELRARLEELATQLSPPLRKAFQLRDLDGLTTSEAARILGVADGTVKAQLARARAKLRRLLRRKRDPQSHSHGSSAMPGRSKK